MDAVDQRLSLLARFRRRICADHEAEVDPAILLPEREKSTPRPLDRSRRVEQSNAVAAGRVSGPPGASCSSTTRNSTAVLAAELLARLTMPLRGVEDASKHKAGFNEACALSLNRPAIGQLKANPGDLHVLLIALLRRTDGRRRHCAFG